MYRVLFVCHEETGMPLWVDALSNRSDWNAYVPDSYKQLFSSVPTLHVSPELMLTTSIRHDFINVSPWVEAILELDMDKARKAYQDMLAKGFQCWRAWDPKKLPGFISYVQQNYPGDSIRGSWFSPISGILQECLDPSIREAM